MAAMILEKTKSYFIISSTIIQISDYCAACFGYNANLKQ